MEVTDAFRVPLDPVHVREALGDLALVRASLDNCESFSRTPNGEYALTLIVPLGACARVTRFARMPPGARKGRGRGPGRCRVRTHPELQGARRRRRFAARPDCGGAESGRRRRRDLDRIHRLSDGVRTARGLAFAADRKCAARGRRRFLRRVLRSRACKARLVVAARDGRERSAPACVPAAGGMSAAFSRRPGAMRGAAADASASGVLRHRLHGHGFVHHERDHSHDPHPLGLPGWAWAAMLVCVALFAYFAEHIGVP